MHTLGLYPELNQIVPFIFGGLGWAVYFFMFIAIIRKGFTEKNYGAPVIGITFVTTWDLYFGYICPFTEACNAAGSINCLCPLISGEMTNVETLLPKVFFPIDFIILYQVFRYGPKQQQLLPELKKYFRPLLFLIVLLTFVMQVSFAKYYRDLNGSIATLLTGPVYSGGFIVLLSLRPKLEGLSYTAAWLKIVGDIFFALGITLVSPDKLPWQGVISNTLIYAILTTVMIFDVLYLAFFYHRRKGLGLTYNHPWFECIWKLLVVDDDDDATSVAPEPQAVEAV